MRAAGDAARTHSGRRLIGAPGRDLGIDRFRGGLVVLMVAGNYLAGVAVVPAFLKHAPDIGLTVADVVAPGFVVAIGLTYGASFSDRAAHSRPGAYRHFVVRYLALIGIGAVISAGSTSIAEDPSGWGVLQALGVAGLLCLPVIRLGVTLRLVIGLLLLGGYQLLLDRWALESVLGSSHGGFVGSLSWAALLILATALADLRPAGVRRLLTAWGALAVLAAVSVPLVPVSKNRVSASYVLVCLAIAVIAWLLVDLGSRAVDRPAGFLCWWGENPLVLYLLHLGLLGVFVLPSAPWWYADASVPLLAAQLVALLATMSLVARALHRRGLRIGL